MSACLSYAEVREMWVRPDEAHAFIAAGWFYVETKLREVDGDLRMRTLVRRAEQRR